MSFKPLKITIDKEAGLAARMRARRVAGVNGPRNIGRRSSFGDMRI
jgi:hypothetical protein